MKRIAILGPGLLGGSIALRLRELGGWQVAMWARRPAAAEEARRICADEASTDLRKIVRGAEVIVFCTPIEAMPALAAEIADIVSPGALVTDVGSVKESVVRALEPVFAGRCLFAGSHPMAGKAEAGLAAAEASLFRGANCIVTPGTGAAAAAEFWRLIDCRVVEMGAREHDECVALISHLPHVVAGALVAAAAGVNARAFEIVGPGFRDTTRVASGPPALWTGILSANQPAVLSALDAMIAKLAEFRHTLTAAHGTAALPGGEQALQDTLAAAKNIRDTIQFPK